MRYRNRPEFAVKVNGVWDLQYTYTVIWSHEAHISVLDIKGYPKSIYSWLKKVNSGNSFIGGK